MMVTPLYIPWVGGLEHLVRQLNVALLERGHELLVATSHGNETTGGWDEVDGVPVLRLSAHDALARRDTALLFEVQRNLTHATRDFAPDVVHSHDAGPVLWMYLRSARRTPRPLVITLHNVMTHHFVGSFELLGSLLARADWVTGVSQDVVDDARAYAPAIGARTSVIRNGISPPAREVTPVPVDPPRLACIGRLVPQKGFDRAIDAFATVAPRHPTLRMAVAGDGPERGRLAERAAERGVADRIDFLGVLDPAGIARLLDASTAVVMPSRFEGLPLVALEAAWAGRPVVATRAPGLDQAVVHDETALVVEPERDALADAIERIVTDPALVHRLGRGAHALAEREFSMAACADAYEALYRQVHTGREPDRE